MSLTGSATEPIAQPLEVKLVLRAFVGRRWYESLRKTKGLVLTVSNEPGLGLDCDVQKSARIREDYRRYGVARFVMRDHADWEARRGVGHRVAPLENCEKH